MDYIWNTRVKTLKLLGENIGEYLNSLVGFPGGASGKECLPMQETQETQVWFLGWEDALE